MTVGRWYNSANTSLSRNDTTSELFIHVAAALFPEWVDFLLTRKLELEVAWQDANMVKSDIDQLFTWLDLCATTPSITLENHNRLAIEQSLGVRVHPGGAHIPIKKGHPQGVPFFIKN